MQQKLFLCSKWRLVGWQVSVCHEASFANEAWQKILGMWHISTISLKLMRPRQFTWNTCSLTSLLIYIMVVFFFFLHFFLFVVGCGGLFWFFSFFFFWKWWIPCKMSQYSVKNMEFLYMNEWSECVQGVWWLCYLHIWPLLMLCEMLCQQLIESTGELGRD